MESYPWQCQSSIGVPTEVVPPGTSRQAGAVVYGSKSSDHAVDGGTTSAYAVPATPMTEPPASVTAASIPAILLIRFMSRSPSAPVARARHGQAGL